MVRFSNGGLENWTKIASCMVKNVRFLNHVKRTFENQTKIVSEKSNVGISVFGIQMVT